MLEISKSMKQGFEHDDGLKINGTSFKVIKNIPGTNHPLQQNGNTKESSADISRVASQFAYGQKPSCTSMTFSKNSSFSASNVSVKNQSSSNLQTISQVQTTACKPQNSGIKELVSNDEQSSKSFLDCSAG